MKNYPIWFCLCLWLVIVSSCKKESQTVYVPQELKELNYPEGSYWIMKNFSTNSLDSVVSYGSGSQLYKSGNNYFEVYTMQFYRFALNGTERNPAWAINIIAKDYGILSDFNISSGGNTVYYSPFLTYPFQATGTDTRFREQSVAVNILPGYTVNGLNFTDVYHFVYTFPNKTNQEEIFLSKESGIIKIVQDNDLLQNTLEVMRFHINE
jgi:hypothetical protein